MRTLLSPAQRAVLFDPPDDRPTVERLYTLGPDDLAETARRRRASNRLGFAVQLCYLRHPGRPLEPGETPSPALLQVLAGQLGCEPGTFCAFALDMEVLLTDAAVAMVEKMVGSLFRRAERTRSERLMDDTRLLKETARLHARLGRALLDVRWAEGDVLSLVGKRIGWEALEKSVRAAENLTRTGEDGLAEVVDRYTAVRRFAPAFLASFVFQAARPNDPLLSAVAILRRFYAEGRSTLPKSVPTSFLAPRWRKVVFPAAGGFDRRAYEIATLVHLRDRLGSGGVWVEGSRAYRTLDDYLLPPATCGLRGDAGGGYAGPGGRGRREPLAGRAA